MELLEAHFSNLGGNLYHDDAADTYTMFSKVGTAKHLNYLTFKALFREMGERRDLTILETGIASAGTQSTYLFNEYVRKYGGRFWSVDINASLVDAHSPYMSPATTLVCGDSVQFLEDWRKNHPERGVDVVYLDSYDLDWYHPAPSAAHGLREYRAIRPAMVSGSLMLIDDTPCSPDWLDDRGLLYQQMTGFFDTHGYLPGKGQTILNEPDTPSLLLHNYQVLYKF